MHPLAPDLSKVTDSELQAKVMDLSRKLSASYRMGNAELIHQVQMLYNECLEEQNTRERKKMEELLKSNNRDFDDIIDVG